MGGRAASAFASDKGRKGGRQGGRQGERQADQAGCRDTRRR